MLKTHQNEFWVPIQVSCVVEITREKPLKSCIEQKLKDGALSLSHHIACELFLCLGNPKSLAGKLIKVVASLPLKDEVVLELQVYTQVVQARWGLCFRPPLSRGLPASPDQSVTMLPPTCFSLPYSLAKSKSRSRLLGLCEKTPRLDGGGLDWPFNFNSASSYIWIRILPCFPWKIYT